MIQCNFIFIFFLLLSSFSVSHAFRGEELVGGENASISTYKYQAAIIGKYNLLMSYYLLGSAAIISHNLLLTAARIFIGGHRNLKKQLFFAAVDQYYLTTNELILSDIEVVYTYLYNPIGKKNDIAVARLKVSLGIRNHLILAELRIPMPNETFYNLTADVAGYGVSSMSDRILAEGRERIRVHTRDRTMLKYASVRITIQEECGASYNNLNHTIFICGVMERDERNGQRGLCAGDIGAPLRVGTQVVGIAIKHRRNCDDTEHGSIYTKVSHFYPFIQGIKDGDFIPYTKAYFNNLNIH